MEKEGPLRDIATETPILGIPLRNAFSSAITAGLSARGGPTPRIFEKPPEAPLPKDVRCAGVSS